MCRPGPSHSRQLRKRRAVRRLAGSWARIGTPKWMVWNRAATRASAWRGSRRASRRPRALRGCDAARRVHTGVSRRVARDADQFDRLVRQDAVRQGEVAAAQELPSTPAPTGRAGPTTGSSVRLRAVRRSWGGGQWRSCERGRSNQWRQSMDAAGRCYLSGTPICRLGRWLTGHRDSSPSIRAAAIEGFADLVRRLERRPRRIAETCGPRHARAHRAGPADRRDKLLRLLDSPQSRRGQRTSGSARADARPREPRSDRDPRARGAQRRRSAADLIDYLYLHNSLTYVRSTRAGTPR